MSRSSSAGGQRERGGLMETEMGKVGVKGRRGLRCRFLLREASQGAKVISGLPRSLLPCHFFPPARIS